MPKRMMPISEEKRAELEALGIDVIGRSTHPMVIASSWGTAGKGAQVLGEKNEHRLLHIYPESTLITPIGNLWEEGSWWRLQDMMLHSTQAGYSVSIHEMRDTSPLPSQAIGLMRWQAAMMARDSGVEWVLMVDNDVWLEKDTLVKLLAHDRPVVFPLLSEIDPKWPIEVSPLSHPAGLEPGQGLVPVRWAAMSVMLFNVRVFNVLDSNAWWGTDYHFSQALNHIGHRIYVDTDAMVRTVKGPTRQGSYTYSEYWDARSDFHDRLKDEERDRNPPPGFNPKTDDGWVDEHGTYFAVPNKLAKEQIIKIEDQ